MTNVIVDSNGVRRSLGDGQEEAITWASLDAVVIVTTDQGPYLEDVFFVLHEGDHGVLVTHEVACEIRLMPWLQELPGFDNDAVIRAMASTEDAHFVCWKRSSVTGT